MAYLINRNPPARLQCLHSLAKFIFNTYGVNVTFRMTDIKYDDRKINIHSFCDLLVENSALGIKYCPYKENPLSKSGCSLTNGLFEDSTKSKEVSNTVNALHALGFINRIGNNLSLTLEGANFANNLFSSKSILPIIQSAVLNYGLFIGLMYQLYTLNKDTFDTDEIIVGYPSANESFFYEGEYVTISSGSEDDSNTRTKSCLLAWATTCGFICPIPLLNEYEKELSHVSSSSYILQSSRNLRKYKIMHVPKNLFGGTFITNRPLDYKNLTKNIGALRENNQKQIRELTMMLEPKIQNRRFAVLYLLAKAFNVKKNISLKLLVDFLLQFEDMFVIEKESFFDVMCEEIKIAFISGIPFEILNNDILKPMTGLNLEELKSNAPQELITTLDKYEL
ncbi:MAG: hypothetical protein JST29_01590 [Bacteroidetes bacterium]|nr:hypothetical protein [Bacteroidota bacterium]